MMQRFYDRDAMLGDVTRAISEALAKHGVGNLYSPLAVCTVLEAIASPMKYQLTATPLTRDLGTAGVKVYFSSRLPMEVELLKSPHSFIVNKVMDALAKAVLKSALPVPDECLLRDTLRVFLNRPRLSQSQVPQALRENSSLDSAFDSAKNYLIEGNVIAQTDEGNGWEINVS